MTAVWNDISIAEELATAGSGAANAVYFAGRALQSTASAPRRFAALVLVALFAGSALEATTHIALGEAGAVAAAARFALLLGNLATFSLILAGGAR